jgi:pimeloyl-ACP methyl ester carboxylesterase
MPTASANGIEIWYETFGDADDVPLLLVMGLGAQAIAWDVDFCRMLVDRGFYVIRFDNRDVGLSTKIESEQIDFAADAVALLDHLEIDAAHVVGASMGGMIVQQLALDFPARVLTVTSIMSTTGDRDVGMPHPEAAATLMRPPAEDRESYIDGSVETWRVIGSPKYFDEAAVRDRAAAAWERGYFPAGTGRQLLGIMASPSRSERLEELKLPALVIHGDVDPLVDVSGGRRTAEVVPGARYLEVEDMAHDMPPQLWPVYVEAITSLVATAGQPA